jgi:hypothetical protein
VGRIVNHKTRWTVRWGTFGVGGIAKESGFEFDYAWENDVLPFSSAVIAARENSHFFNPFSKLSLLGVRAGKIPGKQVRDLICLGACPFTLIMNGL